MKELSAGVLLLSLVSCSKVSSPQPSAQEPPKPAPAKAAPAPPSAIFATFPADTAPSPAAQAPATSAPAAAAVTSAPAPAPALQPHPAAGAKGAAVKMYPELGVKDSLFNKTFRDLYTEKAERDPEFLTRADWPLLLAHRTAEILAPVMTPMPGVTVSAAPASAPPAPVQSAPTTSGHSFNPVPGPNPLDRGAYNQVRSPYWLWNGYSWVYRPPITPAPAPVTDSQNAAGQSTTPANPLERGPYNQTRSPYWWSWSHYYYP